MYRLDRDDRCLFFEGRKVVPTSVEGNAVGFCPLCDGELASIAYYRISGGWMVAARCRGCEKPLLLEYDSSWSWKGEFDLGVAAPEKPAEEIRKASGILALSREELETVFTPAELRDMERCERGEAYTRQNLYRARAKYDKFERLFGVRIDI
ncbi:hypothetical protein P0O24_10365 [Methanotrichaceae archaeon M04Ac]|jgi:hypothetical protein|uniref:Uncharacterized protein n=1 Tax=Candidatus Methanocrinis alkalitolerans TaxID=3033395 RepID=A0ABT5XH77_9EURY|nr:hypothetical protein [Candidatus Methanocrinis alkalitolerans]MCR3882966.1 hypothetical protein [Methanothrix sp.]MDF0593983.1 hypothetical protein [Candidatus Methanocrinis alkalitolerans]